MDYACDSGDADLQLCWEHAQATPEFLNLVQVVMDEEHLQMPVDVQGDILIWYITLHLSLYFNLI